MHVPPSSKHLQILYLTPDLFGPPSGIARYCRLVCRATLAGGHALTTVSLLDQSPARAQAKATFPKMRYFPCADRRGAFIGRALRALRARPDVILVGHPHLAPVGWLLGQIARAPVVNFIYGMDAWEPLSPLRRGALQSSALILSISRFTARRCEHTNGIAPDKVRILHNCLDPDLQHQEAHPPTDALSLLTVGRINNWEHPKGHEFVIRALPQLLQQFPSLTYRVIGNGDGWAPLQKLAAELGVSEAIHWSAFVPEAELARAYAQASVFIMPSQREGFGFVFAEAMAQGVPAIGGDSDATPEVIVDGKTGFLVDPTSVEAITEAAARLLGDADLRRDMGRAAREHVARQFSFDKFEETLLAFLCELLPPHSESVTGRGAPDHASD